MPTLTYGYPTAGEFMEIERVLLPRTNYANSPIGRHFPDEMHEGWTMYWTQLDNMTGMAQIRGLNGEPPRVVPLGQNRFQAEPGVYGEQTVVDERELTTRATMAGPGGRLMPTREMVLERAAQLLDRRNVRKEWLGWQLLVYGYFKVTDLKGAVVHTDGYNQQQYTSSVSWGTAATSTPLADLRAVQLLSRGTSSSFGTGAVGYLNRTTANQLMANTNAADIGGKKAIGLASITSLADQNRIFAAEGLPQLEVYDEGYIDETTGLFTLYIPNNAVIIVGQRPGAVPIGAFFYMSNASNNGTPGPYTAVVDNIDTQAAPRTITVHDGFNGGPVLRFPGSVVKMNV